MESTDLVLMKSVTISDADANGGRQSYTQVTSNVLNNMFANVSQTDRTAGVTKYRKFFFRNKNAADETATNSRVWIASRSTGEDYFRIKAGTDTDTQAEADDYTEWLGSGYLDGALATDATTFDAIFDNNDGVYDGSMIRVTDSSGGEEFLTVKSSGGVSWLGNTATIVTTTGARSTYPSGQNSVVSGVVDLGSLIAATSAWAETTATGTYDEATYPVEVNNPGPVSDTWTLTFTAATTFTVSGTNTGSVGSGSTASNFSPINANAGGGVYYFLIRSAGWGGTWAIGETVTFTTTHSSAGWWSKEVVPASTAAKSSNSVGFKMYVEGA